MGSGLAAEPGVRLLLAEDEAVNGAWMGGYSVCNEKAPAANGGFSLVRPAGRTHLEVKVLYAPDRGKR